MNMEIISKPEGGEDLAAVCENHVRNMEMTLPSYIAENLSETAKQAFRDARISILSTDGLSAFRNRPQQEEQEEAAA